MPHQKMSRFDKESLTERLTRSRCSGGVCPHWSDSAAMGMRKPPPAARDGGLAPLTRLLSMPDMARTSCVFILCSFTLPVFLRPTTGGLGGNMNLDRDVMPKRSSSAATSSPASMSPLSRYESGRLSIVGACRTGNSGISPARDADTGRTRRNVSTATSFSTSRFLTSTQKSRLRPLQPSHLRYQ